VAGVSSLKPEIYLNGNFKIHLLTDRKQIMFPLQDRLWSSGQSSWLQIHMSRVRFPALPDFLSSSGSGTGSTQPREDN
jgi:hypothetical protein